MAKIKLNLVTPTEVTVVAAGTPVPLSGTSLEVTGITLQIRESNVGAVYVGDSSVAPDACIRLDSSNPSCEILVDDTFADEDRAVVDLADIFIDAANNGDGVLLSYISQTLKSYNS